MEYVSVLWRPVDALAHVARERNVLVGFAVVALWAVVGLISSGIGIATGATTRAFEQNPEIPPELVTVLRQVTGVGALVFSALAPFLWWIVLAGLMYLITGFFGGRGPFPAMLAVTGVAMIPWVVQSLVGIPLAALQLALGNPSSAGGLAGTAGLTGISVLLGLGALAWHIALVVIGGRFAREVTYGQSGGSCALSCVGCLGIAFVLTLLLALIPLLLA